MKQPFLTLSCLVTLSDIDCAKDSSSFDQQTIGWNAVSLVLAGILALVAWNALFLQFYPLWQAFPLALLLAAIVFRLDQSMSASDWELAGILRQRPLPREWYLKLAARVLVAWLLAYATALGLMLAFFSDAITNKMQSDRSQANKPIEEEYSQRNADLRKRLVVPLEEELKALNEQRSNVEKSVVEHQRMRTDAWSRASAARIEAGREKDGGQVAGHSYIRGEGPRWNEAQRQQGEADKQARLAVTAESELRTKISEVQGRIDAKLTDLKAANAEYDRQSGDLKSEKLKDPRYIPVRDDPMLRYVAFEEMKADPKQGGAVSQLSLLAQIVMLTLELSFLLTKVVFAHASVYTVRLIAKTKLGAAEVASDFAGNRDEIGRQRPSLRVVPRAVEQAEPVTAQPAT